MENNTEINSLYYVLSTSMLILSGSILGITLQYELTSYGNQSTSHWLVIALSAIIFSLSILGLIFVLNKDWKRIAVIIIFLPLLILISLYIFVFSFYLLFIYALILHGFISVVIPSVGNILLLPQLKKDVMIHYVFYAVTFIITGII